LGEHSVEIPREAWGVDTVGALKKDSEVALGAHSDSGVSVARTRMTNSQLYVHAVPVDITIPAADSLPPLSFRVPAARATFSALVRAVLSRPAHLALSGTQLSATVLLAQMACTSVQKV